VLVWPLVAAAVLGQLRDFVQQGRLWWPFLIPISYLPIFLTTQFNKRLTNVVFVLQ
jgi:hypothetical protein